MAFCCCQASFVPLTDYADAPEYLKGNPHIRKGYRDISILQSRLTSKTQQEDANTDDNNSINNNNNNDNSDEYVTSQYIVTSNGEPTLVYKMYLRVLFSMFSWHNETMNVWTHLIGSWICLYLAISSCTDVFDGQLQQEDDETNASTTLHVMFSSIFLNSGSAIQELLGLNENSTNRGLSLASEYQIPIALILVSYAMAFFSSAVYHLFGCLSLNVHHRLVQLDYTGICLMIGTSFGGSLYFGFFCYPLLRLLYVGIIVLILLRAFYVIYKPTDGGIDAAQNVMFGAVCYALIPMCHWIYLNGFESPAIQNFLWRLLLMFGIYGLAFILYKCRLPESIVYLPGPLHLSFHSHALWHILTLTAALWSYFSLIAYIDFQVETGCPARA